MESFVIQIATPLETTAKTCPPQLRGVVEHVGSGQRERFADVCELVAFLLAGHRRATEQAKT